MSTTNNAITHLQNLIRDVDLMTYNTKQQRPHLISRAEMILRKCFGEANEYTTKLKKLGFIPTNTNPTTLNYMSKFNSGKNNFIALLNLAVEELNIDIPQTVSQKDRADSIPGQIDNKSIFIVHGHDRATQQSLARTIEKLGLIPIILGEQANQGTTIIEKFEKHSTAGFAVVLLTGDDEGKVKGHNHLNARARQNVILELGFFMGKLGRDRVLPLYVDGVELPSDMHGVVYTLLDEHGHWKYRFVKELKAAGYNVDANLLL